MQQPVLPLAGIRVIDYSHFIAGPYMSRCLAAFGADVIKVERPTSGEAGRTHPYVVDGYSGYFFQQNMGKRGLCVDLKDARGLELMQKLVVSADVFIENYRPGTLEKLGLGYQALSELNPKLVYCSVSANGHTGPDSTQVGFGLIAEAKSGAMAQMGVPGEPPPLLRLPIADMYTGIHGVAAVCAALLARAQSGTGQHIDLALYDCMVSMHDFAVQAYSMSGGKVLPKQVGHDNPDLTIYGVFAARDGYLVIAAQVDDAWKRLAELIGGSELADDVRFHLVPSRNAHRDEALARVRAWTMEQDSVKDCIRQLREAAVPCAPVQRIDEVMADPQIIARGMILEQDHPVLGRVKLANLPFRFSSFETQVPCIAPDLGAHNREIAATLGYSDADIERLMHDGVLYDAKPAALQGQAA